MNNKFLLQFPNEIKAGLLEVIAPNPNYYPDLTNLTQNFGDSQERVKWRSKQNLDFALLMNYAKSRGKYYMQLEDDVKPKTFKYVRSIKSHISKQNMSNPNWFVLSFAPSGFIAKLFRSQDLSTLVTFFLTFYQDQPVDFLIVHLIRTKVCLPEDKFDECDAKMKSVRRPSSMLFDHIGVNSSLNGKVFEGKFRIKPKEFRDDE